MELLILVLLFNFVKYYVKLNKLCNVILCPVIFVQV